MKRAPHTVHEDEAVKLWHGDCRDWLALQGENVADSIVTDSPYEAGIGGAAWDMTGVSFDPEVWKLCYRFLKPGAILVNFALPRLYHRMACAVEDAGFRILDMVDWFYGQGKPASGTLLKPGHEPIIIAMKPLSEPTIGANRARWGTGGLWPDQARLSTGRWPPNVMLSHAEDCTEHACGESCPVAELDRQSGVRRSGKMKAGTIRSRKAGGAFGAMAGAPMPRDTYADVGGASRFIWCSKVKGAARIGHLSEKPEDVVEQLIRLTTPPVPNAWVVDPFVGSGPTLEAARRLGYRSDGVELEQAHCRMCLTRIERNAALRKAS